MTTAVLANTPGDKTGRTADILKKEKSTNQTPDFLLRVTISVATMTLKHSEKIHTIEKCAILDRGPPS